MHVTAHTVYVKTLSEPLAKWQKRRARALAPELLDAALMLLRLDLDPLLPMLVTLYSPSPRGRPAHQSSGLAQAAIQGMDGAA